MTVRFGHRVSQKQVLKEANERTSMKLDEAEENGQPCLDAL